MDKRYFVNDGKKQLGPLSLDDLSKLPLKATNKVWVEGSADWKDATEYEELQPFIIKMPPPLPRIARNSKFIAKEIKINTRLVLLALIIGICSYPVIAYFKNGFKSLS